jgi:hypothetical protein
MIRGNDQTKSRATSNVDIALDLSHNRRVILRYLIAFDRHKPGN